MPLQMSLGNGLRPHVSSYTEFDMAGWPPGRHRGLPSAGLAFVLSFSSPLVVRSPGRGVVSSSATVAGLTSEPVEVLHDGTQRGLQLELTPHGARALLGIPAAVLAGGVFALEEVVGQPACELVERLAEASNPVARAPNSRDGAQGLAERGEIPRDRRRRVASTRVFAWRCPYRSDRHRDRPGPSALG